MADPDSDFVDLCAFVVSVPVGICTCPSLSCVAGAEPEDDADTDDDETTSGFDIPNCVEY